MSQRSKSRGGMKLLKQRMFLFVGLAILKWVEGMEDTNVTDIDMLYVNGRGFYRPLMVGITLINGAAAKGAGIHSFFTYAYFLWR